MFLYSLIVGVVLIITLLDLVSSMRKQSPTRHGKRKPSHQRSARRTSPTTSAGSIELDNEAEAYLDNLKVEIDTGPCAEFLFDIIFKEVEKGRGEKDLKRDIKLHNKLFEEMFSKKILGQDRNGYKKEIKQKFKNGTLTDEEVDKIFNKMVAEIRTEFDELMTYLIDDQTSDY
uniref:Uncharacterized protein n=1 Tax=Cacopsylla melanoneura TaxID=428564 RepID=A0A8D8QM72_9HEMI